MRTFSFWQKWLSWANVVALGMGLIVAFAGNSLILSPHNELTVDLFFGGQAMNPQLLQFKNWLFGVIGGTMVGFHLLMIFLSEHAFKQQEKWAWQAMSLSTILWFVIDSGVSLYTGAWHNVVLINLVALFMIGLPLLMTFSTFFPRQR